MRATNMRGVSSFLLRNLLILTVLAMAAMSLDSEAASDSELRANLRACHTIPNALRRLDCFDRLARNADNSGSSDSAEAPTSETPGARITRPRSDPSASATDRNISSQLTRLEQRPRGEWVFHLDNGQIWTETEPGRVRYEEGAEVQISRTLFGGHILSVEGMRATRVRRLQ